MLARAPTCLIVLFAQRLLKWLRIGPGGPSRSPSSSWPLVCPSGAPSQSRANSAGQSHLKPSGGSRPEGALRAGAHLLSPAHSFSLAKLAAAPGRLLTLDTFVPALEPQALLLSCFQWRARPMAAAKRATAAGQIESEGARRSSSSTCRAEELAGRPRQRANFVSTNSPLAPLRPRPGRRRAALTKAY